MLFNLLHPNLAKLESAQFTNKYLTVTGSLLATYVDESVQTGDSPEDKKKITPSISVSYLPFEEANLRLRGSYKKIFRVPTFDDMYYTRMGNINLKPEYAKNAKWTLYDLQDKLSQHGWMVPAYTLPSKLEDYVVMRVVVRQGFSRDMADMLLGDINNAITELEKLEYPTPTRMAQEKNLPVEAKMFNHGGRRKTVKK